VTLGQRDKRALMLLGGAAIVCVVLWLALPAERQTDLVKPVDTIPAAAKHLSRVRQLAATFPAEEKSQQIAAAQLAAREKGMLQADTPAQAQAHGTARTAGRRGAAHHGRRCQGQGSQRPTDPVRRGA